MSRLLGRVRQSVSRDRSLPLAEIARKAVHYGKALVSAPRYLRACDVVGRRPRTRGRPIVTNLGRIAIGDDFQANCAFSPVELRAARGGELDIGDRVDINFGTSIIATGRVRIGSGVSFGPYVTVSDGGTLVDAGAATVSGIDIGDGVWLAARVTVGPGITIGANTVVTAGSLVTSSLPAGVIAGGVPARVLRQRDPDAALRVEPTATARAEGATANDPLPPATRHRGVLLSDVTIQELEHPLRAHGIAAFTAPFDQVVPSLHGIDDLAARHGDDFAVVWCRPERVSPMFARRLAGEHVDLSDIVADVDSFVGLLRSAATKVRVLLLPTFTTPPDRRGLGLIDWGAAGAARAVAAMNLRVAQLLDDETNIFLLDASRWMQLAQRPYVAKLWYQGKVRFSSEVLDSAAADIAGALSAMAGLTRKLLVLDLDDTVWGGVVGDVGWESLRLGGHDPVGEAFQDFQREVLALSRRGIALAVVSKNEESVALDAMRSHPEMVLRPDHLSAWRINWNDKARNVADLVAELNLGLQSVVFIDDNPVERERVRSALPEVLVPEWPTDPCDYVSALSALRCFDTGRLSKEDTERTKLYADERARNDARTSFASLDEWLDDLNTTVRFERLDRANIVRATQLLNKTNQMNLRTRRMTEAELTAWASAEGHEVWAAHVSDRLGDAGLTGIVSIELDEHDDGDLHAPPTAAIADYLLSCRVMGRRVEETIVWFATLRAGALGAATLHAELIATPKNKPCRDFWVERSGFTRDQRDSTAHDNHSDGDVRLRWDLTAPYPRPKGVTVVGADAIGEHVHA